MADYYSNSKEVEKKRETLVDKLARCESVGLMYLKGYTWRDIAEDQGITPAYAKQLADEYVNLIRESANNDPDFMDRIQENTLRFLKEFEEISKEAWETVRISTDAGMVTARINALKLSKEVAETKARLLQLLGGKVDSGYIARMQRAENVNQLLSSVIREIVADCDHCRAEAHIRLQEAFAMMGNDERAIEAQIIEEEEDEHEDSDCPGGMLGVDEFEAEILIREDGTDL